MPNVYHNYIYAIYKSKSFFCNLVVSLRSISPEVSKFFTGHS